MPAATQEEKRRQILAAAVRAFARKGYHACRVGEIAEEAGVAYGLVYHYFGSKEEVLETIFRETWTQMLARVHEVQEEGGSAGEQVRKVTALLLRTWRRDPDLVRVLVHEVTRSPSSCRGRSTRSLMPTRRSRASSSTARKPGSSGATSTRSSRPRSSTAPSRKSSPGWVMGQLPDTDEDIARAEHVVTGLICDGLATRS